MAWINDVMAKLTVQGYPKGRAFKLPAGKNFLGLMTSQAGQQIITEGGVPIITENAITAGGVMRRIHKALDVSQARFYAASRSTYDSILPDNSNFMAQDATEWNVRLGIATSNTDLTTMKQAIQRKMNDPGTTAPHQSAAYMQEQLQAAGFPLYVYMNRFSDGSGGYMTQTPAEVLGISIGEAVYGNFDYGQLDYGAGYANAGISVVSNHIEDAADVDFTIFPDYRSTFYVAGNPITSFVDVPAARHDELRQLILTIKPLQAIGFLFVNYI